MKKNKKVPLSQKPFLVLSRRAIAGWVGVIFLVCAWMFVIGVLVGRGTAPVKFDIEKLQTKLEDARQHLKNQEQERVKGDAGVEKDKTKLDFYEVLKENQEDAKIDKIKPSQKIIKKIEPQPEKMPSMAPGETTKIKSKPIKTKATQAPSKQQTASKRKAEAGGKIYTIQAASVRASRDADKLVAALKVKGFPAYRAVGVIPGKGIWYRVRIGEFKSRADAGSTLEKLRKAGMKPILVEK